MKSRTGQFAAALLFLASVSCGDDSSDATQDPNPPSNLMAEELEGGAHLTWKDNSDDEGEFMIERKVGTAEFATYKSVDFNTTQYHDTDITRGTTYGYRVMAMPKGGGDPKNPKYSNEVTFKLP